VKKNKLSTVFSRNLATILNHATDPGKSSSIAEASSFKKQNFMSDKKRNTFFHLILYSRDKNTQKKPGEKKFNFFFIEQIVIVIK
jgi:hypothetical protein